MSEVDSLCLRVVAEFAGVVMFRSIDYEKAKLCRSVCIEDLEQLLLLRESEDTAD